MLPTNDFAEKSGRVFRPRDKSGHIAVPVFDIVDFPIHRASTQDHPIPVRNRLKKPQTACYTAQESKDRHNVSPLVALLRCFEQIQHEMILGLRLWNVM